MNQDVGIDESVVAFYDSDYPSEFISEYPENFDETTEFQGVRHDVRRYLDIARRVDGPVLEVCCGTGRVAIPLAREGHAVTAVDIAHGMIERFRSNLERETEETRKRITLVHQDATRLALDRAGFGLCIIAFNSLPCIPTAHGQRQALRAIARHVRTGGSLVLDTINPLVLGISGQPFAKPFYTRRSAATGNRYTRMAMYSPFDQDNRQRIYGWYDEERPDGSLTRSHYSMYWRPIFKPELDLMLNVSGFAIDSIEGGHRGEPFSAASPRMFVTATRQETDSLEMTPNAPEARHSQFL